jgi:hypothetical protein
MSTHPIRQRGAANPALAAHPGFFIVAIFAVIVAHVPELADAVSVDGPAS